MYGFTVSDLFTSASFCALNSLSLNPIHVDVVMIAYFQREMKQVGIQCVSAKQTTRFLGTLKSHHVGK